MTLKENSDGNWTVSFKNKEVLKVAMKYVKLDGGWFENFEFKGTSDNFFWPGRLHQVGYLALLYTNPGIAEGSAPLSRPSYNRLP